MQRLTVLSVLGIVLIFNGCGSKEPAIDATKNNLVSISPTNSVIPSSDLSQTDNSAVISPITSIDTNSGQNGSLSGTNGSGTNGMNGSINANGSDGGLVSILFDYDRFDIREDMQPLMSKNSILLKGKSIKLEGNCDEFGSDEYNYALGLKRANSVKTELINNGMNPESISMSSLGEGNPLCIDKTEECWAKNRRVDFKQP